MARLTFVADPQDCRGRTACAALLALGAVRFALIFTKPDLLAWGAYES